MITNILDQSFTNFTKTIEKKVNDNPQRQRLDTLASYYTDRVSTNEVELITKYADSLVSGGQPHTPDPRLYMRRDLLGLVQDAYALGTADAIDDLQDVQFSYEKTDADFALSPDDKLQRDIQKLQRDIQASQNIVRQTKTLNQYTSTLQALQTQAQALNNTQATQTLGQLSQQLQTLKTNNTVKSVGKLVNQQIQKGQTQQSQAQATVNQQIAATGSPNTQDYLIKRAIEEKLKYLENRRDSLASTPPVVLDEDNDFFRWYADKRLVPIANRYQQGLTDKNNEAKDIATKYTEEINKGTTTQTAKGAATDKIVRRLLNIEDKAIAKGRPVKRVQRVVATELAIAYNIGRLKAYMKAGVQYVTTSTSMYSPDVCEYCAETAAKTEEEPIKISSLLKNAYRNQGFNKDTQPKVSDLRYLPNHPYCFVDGTMVTMYDILKGKEYQKNISEIVVGDYVKVPTKNKYQKVVQTHKNHYGEYLYKIRTNTGQTITTTGNHPLWDGSDWREAQHFSIGDSLFTSSFENQRTDGTSVRTQQDYKKCNRFVSTDENQQQVGHDNSKGVGYSQNSQGDVNRKEQDRQRFKATQLRSDESQQPLKRFRGQKEDVSFSDQHNKTTTSLQQVEQNTEWQRRSLQKWVQRNSRTLCKKRLGIKCRVDSSKIRLKIRVRESVAVSRWQNLFTRLLSGGLGRVHRGEGLLDRRWQGKVRSLSGTVSRNQNGFVRQRQLSETNQSFQGLDRVCIESIERFVEPQFVYNISVVDDNMYFANGILSHNCYCYYKPHPKRDPEEKDGDSTGIYADPNSWKFILGAGLGVSLVFLAFALTTGRKIVPPTTIPAIVPRTKLPIVSKDIVTETIPVVQPLQLPQGVPQIKADPRQPLPNLTSTIFNDFMDYVLASDLPEEKQALVAKAFLQRTSGDIVDDILDAELRLGQITTVEYAKKLTEEFAKIKGLTKKLYFRKFDRIAGVFNKTVSPDSMIKKLETRVDGYVDAVEGSAITRAANNIEKTKVDKQLQPISLLRSDLVESLDVVNKRTNKKEGDLSYIKKLEKYIADLDNFATILRRQKTELQNIKASIRVVNKAVVQQQISVTQSIVERLADNPLLLQEAQDEYQDLLEMLVVLPQKEVNKYRKVQIDLNREIKSAQGLTLKRFMGSTVGFSKYSLASYKYS